MHGEKPASCVLLLSSIKPPESYIFAGIFCIIATVACCGNTISLIVIWKSKIRSQSNKLLTSLIVADALVGYIQLPLTAWNLMAKTDTLQNCTFEGIRAFFIVSLTGASALAIVFIAYDRYILLTNLTSESERHLSDKQVYVMIIINWVLPMTAVSLRYVDFIAYMFVLLFFSVQPLIAMMIAYFIIVRTIRKNEKELQVIYRKESVTEDRRLKQRGTKMGIVAVLLITVYFLSSLPTSIYFILYLRASNRQSFVNSHRMQIFHLCAMVVFSLNSCINPVIYASKYPEFRTILRTMMRSYWHKMFN